MKRPKKPLVRTDEGTLRILGNLVHLIGPDGLEIKAPDYEPRHVEVQKHKKSALFEPKSNWGQITSVMFTRHGKFRGMEDLKAPICLDAKHTIEINVP